MSINLLSKEAKLCVNYSVNVQKGESVLIWGSERAIPLIKEIYREVLRAGGHPITKIDFLEQEYIFYKEAQEHHLNYSDSFSLYYIQNIDIIIRIIGGNNIRELSNINYERFKKYKLAQNEIWKIFFQRQIDDKIKWLIVVYPSESMSQEAKMSREEFANLIEKACFLHKPDPITEWQTISRKQQKYCDYLEKIDELHIVGKKTDLIMSIKGRKWENCDGKVNLPDGEIFTGPIENSINGFITFPFPFLYLGKEIKNVTLKFKNGRVIEAKAEKGGGIINEIIKIPGCRRVGEIGVGLNYNLKQSLKNMIFGEKIGGTIHLALGIGYPKTGSKNLSFSHIDLICDMRIEGKIFADEKLIYQNGKFLIKNDRIK